MAAIRLICNDTTLDLPRSAIIDDMLRGHYSDLGIDHMLIYRHPEGDCDSIHWPNPNEAHLRAALYEARECGLLPSDCRSVELPDGSEFLIEEPESDCSGIDNGCTCEDCTQLVCDALGQDTPSHSGQDEVTNSSDLIDIADAVLEFADAHYNDGDGWDVLVECFTARDLGELLDLQDDDTYETALAKAREYVTTHYEHTREVQSS